MVWKTLVFAFLAVGALAQLQVTDEQRQQYRDLLRLMCKNNGAEDKLEQVTNATTTFVDCIKGLFDIETIKKEVEEAKPKGELDEVFKKYCAKSPQLKACIHALTDGVSPCLDASLRDQIATSNNATDSLIDFVCFKDGDRIALFIAEGGPECFVEKREPIQECARKLKETVPSVDAAKALNLTDQCAKYDELSTCITKALEGCSTPTPANMAESLMRYIRARSPCDTK